MLPMRPHEMLLLLLPLSSRHLLPAPLRPLAAAGYASPLGALYAMEVDARLAALREKCREVGEEARVERERLVVAVHRANLGAYVCACVRACVGGACMPACVRT